MLSHNSIKLVCFQDSRQMCCWLWSPWFIWISKAVVETRDDIAVVIGYIFYWLVIGFDTLQLKAVQLNEHACKSFAVFGGFFYDFHRRPHAALLPRNPLYVRGHLTCTPCSVYECILTDDLTPSTCLMSCHFSLRSACGSHSKENAGFKKNI